MSNLDLAIIGNGTFAALIDKKARISWCCLPKFDSDPVFCSLLDGDTPEDGMYDIELIDFSHSAQSYLPNSAIVRTELHDRRGGIVEILDFAPRYLHYGRSFRPNTIIRIVKPLSGSPRIRIRVRPKSDWGSRAPDITRGSNHIRYVTPDQILRLTSNAPVSYIAHETPFILDRQLTLVLGPDEPLSEDIVRYGQRLLDNTHRYWLEFSRALAIPFEWQDVVIRSAITLKICSQEETGAVVAALTTSIPEAAHTERNWDYRYCWLRDAYFVIQAMNRLGTTKTMEGYIAWIVNVVANAENGILQPVYGIGLEHDLVETKAEALRGYRGMGPVRVGNQAYEQIQNDSYGAVILAVTQAFYDQRLVNPGDENLFRQLETLGYSAIALYDKPDAGLWELRTKAHVHTFSSVMCWAACDRLSKIAEQVGLAEPAVFWKNHADRMKKVILERSWNAEMNSFVDSFDGDKIDACLLLLHEIGFIDPMDPRFVGTVQAVEKTLRRGDFLFRYVHADDFGTPETAFTICTFWYIDALAAIGRKDEARKLFENLLNHRNHVGLLSEDIDPQTGELWGNFPQTYSMVGMINSATRLSKSWGEAF